MTADVGDQQPPSDPPVQPNAPTEPPPELQQIIQAFHMRTEYAAPIPLPQMMQQYDQVLPGSARRIFDLFEGETHHRQAQERALVQANISLRGRGQMFAFIIAMTVIIGGIVVIALGKSTAGLVAVLAGVGSLVAAFLYAQRQNGGSGPPPSQQEQPPKLEE